MCFGAVPVFQYFKQENILKTYPWKQQAGLLESLEISPIRQFAIGANAAQRIARSLKENGGRGVLHGVDFVVVPFVVVVLFKCL